MNRHTPPAFYVGLGTMIVLGISAFLQVLEIREAISLGNEGLMISQTIIFAAIFISLILWALFFEPKGTEVK